MKRCFSLSELQKSLDVSIESVKSPRARMSDNGMSSLRRSKSQENLKAATARAAQQSLPSPSAAAANASRVPVLSEKELREHFNMPLNEVAKKYGMCTTALKKLCRKYGVMQWPHRKLRSLEKKIASLRAEQRYTTDGQGQLDDEIRRLEMHREGLISGKFDADDGQWSPTPMSPGEEGNDLIDDADPRPADIKKRPAPAKTSKPTKANAKVDNGNEEKLLAHIQSLEEENSSLRAISRALMKERQELMQKNSTSSHEIGMLRKHIDKLQGQLAIAKENDGRGSKLFSGMMNEEEMMDIKRRYLDNADNSEWSPNIQPKDSAAQERKWKVEDPEAPELSALSWMAPDMDNQDDLDGMI